MTGSDIIAKLICGIIFIMFPTCILRDTVKGDDVFSVLLRQIYLIDPADNLFPSIHCLESWMCVRSAWWNKKAGKSYRIVQLVFTILVFMSTVLLKQHYLPDIAGGIAVAEIGILVFTKIYKDKDDT